MAPIAHVVTNVGGPIGLGSEHPYLEVLTVPALRDNLVWVLVDRRAGTAATVDGPDAEGALACIAREGLRLTTVLVTHTHGDHVGVVHDLARRGLLSGVRVIGPGAVAAAIPGLTDPVAPGEHGDQVDVLGVAARVLATEGHLDGHVSYVVGRALFCGDALFTGGCGRMFSGPAAKFQAGLARLRDLPDDTLVFCAHEYTEDNLRFARSLEPDDAALAQRVVEVEAARAQGHTVVPSTLGLEKATNPFLRWDSPAVIAAVRAALPDADTSGPAEIFAATRHLKDLGHYRR